MIQTPLGLQNPDVEMHDSSEDNTVRNFYWHLLDDSQIREIKEPGERYIFSVIYGMPEEESMLAAACFGPRKEFFKEYIKWQLPWVETAAYYLGITKKLEDPRHSPELVNQITREIGPDYNLYILAREPGYLEPKQPDTSERALKIAGRYYRSLILSREIYRQNPILLESRTAV